MVFEQCASIIYHIQLQTLRTEECRLIAAHRTNGAREMETTELNWLLLPLLCMAHQADRNGGKNTPYV